MQTIALDLLLCLVYRLYLLPGLQWRKPHSELSASAVAGIYAPMMRTPSMQGSAFHCACSCTACVLHLRGWYFALSCSLLLSPLLCSPSAQCWVSAHVAWSLGFSLHSAPPIPEGATPSLDDKVSIILCAPGSLVWAKYLCPLTEKHRQSPACCDVIKFLCLVTLALK